MPLDQDLISGLREKTRSQGVILEATPAEAEVADFDKDRIMLQPPWPSPSARPRAPPRPDLGPGAGPAPPGPIRPRG